MSDATSVLFISSSSNCIDYRASVESYKTFWYPTFGNPNLLPIPEVSEHSGQCQMIDSLFHGLRTLLLDHCVDYPKLSHLYFSQYGNASVDEKVLGFPASLRHSRASYAKHTHPKHAYLWSLHDDDLVDRNEYSILRRIDNGEFDAVIYADVYHRELKKEVYIDDKPMLEMQLFWQKVVKRYAKGRIGLVDALDRHDSSHVLTMKAASDKGVLFVKEIDDRMLYTG